VKKKRIELARAFSTPGGDQVHANYHRGFLALYLRGAVFEGKGRKPLLFFPNLSHTKERKILARVNSLRERGEHSTFLEEKKEKKNWFSCSFPKRDYLFYTDTKRSPRSTIFRKGKRGAVFTIFLKNERREKKIRDSFIPEGRNELINLGRERKGILLFSDLSREEGDLSLWAGIQQPSNNHS